MIRWYVACTDSPVKNLEAARLEKESLPLYHPFSSPPSYGRRRAGLTPRCPHVSFPLPVVLVLLSAMLATGCVAWIHQTVRRKFKPETVLMILSVIRYLRQITTRQSCHHQEWAAVPHAPGPQTGSRCYKLVARFKLAKVLYLLDSTMEVHGLNKAFRIVEKSEFQ
ncbi:hypothetical protein NDU88_000263 [Pleurodeles waltl]|uniref:Uncharacterized protein n=1 Tax=Pleurodeles waltl TaxID=8319 RepID=A0AAV7KLT0_PLEWA|nr:hypothetical protein NDU88_000263 [Pleurodeles waltl]